MTPSRKSAEMEAAFASMNGFDRRTAILADQCQPKPVGCGEPASSFRDELSAKEYSISGLCQKCQDIVFGTDEPDEWDEDDDDDDEDDLDPEDDPEDVGAP